MKKIHILKENEEYNRIIQKIKPYKSKNFIIYLERTKNEYYHFGFSIGKKICNAVGRNHLKRQLKSIIDEKDYQNNFNCIIMVRKAILDMTFLEIKKELLEVFTKLNIIKEKIDEK